MDQQFVQSLNCAARSHDDVALIVYAQTDASQDDERQVLTVKFGLYHSPFLRHSLDRDISNDLRFSVASSPKGGIDIEVCSTTLHVPLHCSVHHPVVQMVLFATVYCDAFYCPDSMVPKVVPDIIEKSSSDACSRDLNNVYEAGWAPEKNHSARLRKPGTAPEFNHLGKLDHQTNRSDASSFPVIFKVSDRSDTQMSGISRCNTTQDGQFVTDCRASCHGNGDIGITLGQTIVDYAVCDSAVPKLASSCHGNGDIGITLGQTIVDYAVCDSAVPKLASATVSNAIEFIGCAQSDKAKVNYDPSNIMQLYCLHSGLDSSVQLLVPEEDQHILNNPWNDQHDLIYDFAAAADGPKATYSGIFSRGNSIPAFFNFGIDDSEKPAAPVWYIASGACHHMTGDLNLLSDFRPVSNLFVHAGDGAPMQVFGIGTVNTNAVFLPDVWLVPGLTANLVSAGQLTELGMSIVFGRGVCHIKNAAASDHTVVVGEARVGANGVFKVDFLKVP